MNVQLLWVLEWTIPVQPSAPLCYGLYSLGHNVAKCFATESKNKHFLLNNSASPSLSVSVCFHPFGACSALLWYKQYLTIVICPPLDGGLYRETSPIKSSSTKKDSPLPKKTTAIPQKGNMTCDPYRSMGYVPNGKLDSGQKKCTT